jgi:hypothetical protein
MGIQEPVYGYSVWMAMQDSKTLARLMEKKKGKGKEPTSPTAQAVP